MPDPRPNAAAAECASPHTGIPVLANEVLAGTLMAGATAQLFVLPLLLRGSLHWMWAGVAVAFFTNTHWSLIHEGMHGSLHPKPRVNDRLARGMAIVFGIGFHSVRFGHLIHHRFNRCPIDRSEIYDSERIGWRRAAVTYYFRLCGGLYVSEIAAGQASLLPRPVLKGLLTRALKRPDPAVRKINRLAIRLVDGPQLARMRTDALASLALYCASAYLYGRYWLAAAALLALRGLLLSVLDNAFHYGTPIDSGTYARNLKLPKPLSGWLLHFNWHHLHHRRPSLPWPALSRWGREEGAEAEPYGAALLRQFRGPIPLSRLRG